MTSGPAVVRQQYGAGLRKNTPGGLGQEGKRARRENFLVPLGFSLHMCTIWNGSINPGLVNILIGLAVAQQRKDVSFRTPTASAGRRSSRSGGARSTSAT